LRTPDEVRSLAEMPRNKPGVDRILAAYATVGAGDAVGLNAEVGLLYKLHSVDPELESAWFQPLNL
jgi:hypothetical protein